MICGFTPHHPADQLRNLPRVINRTPTEHPSPQNPRVVSIASNPWNVYAPPLPPLPPDLWRGPWGEADAKRCCEQESRPLRDRMVTVRIADPEFGGQPQVPNSPLAARG